MKWRQWSFLYIFLHLLVALFGVRFWPLTDYPMFADPIHQSSPIIVYKYYGFTEKGEQQPLPRSFFLGDSMGEPNLTSLFLSGDLKTFKKHTRAWLHSQKTYVRVGLFKVMIDKKDQPITPQSISQEPLVMVSFN